MKIGITFNLKDSAPSPAGAPDDLFEEFDEPETIRAIAAVIRGLGHEVVELGDGEPMLRRLLAEKPDFVFNFAEGQGIGRSREARVPAVLEMLGIPYSGSDPLALAAALDKDVTRRLVESAGVGVPDGFTVAFEDEHIDSVPDELAGAWERQGLALPVIAKPVCEGSSKGIRSRCLIAKPEEFAPTVVQLWNDYRQPVLVEEFVAGDEVTVGVIGNSPPRVFGVMRITPVKPTEHFVYSLEVKRDFRRQVRYECPAKLPPEVTQAIEEAALAAFDALGCRDVARVDFRMRDGEPVFLEINPLPGLNPSSSDLVIMAGLLKVSHAELVGMIVTEALKRVGRNSP